MNSENIHQPILEEENQLLSTTEKLANGIDSCPKDELKGIWDYLNSNDILTNINSRAIFWF